MSNSLLTVDMITRAALEIAHEKATFIGTVNRTYDDQFAKDGGGGKIGDTLRIRKPNQYVRRQGSRVMDVQEQAEASVALTVATQDGVDMRFNSAELALSIEDFSRRYIEPAVSVLVSSIDGDFITAMTKKTFNTVGTAGTVVGTVTAGFSDTSALGQARAKLNQYLAPKDNNRALQMDSITMASVSNGIKGLFHPETQVKDAFREGFIARTAMADIYENERTWTVSNPGDVAGEIDESTETNFVEGATTLHIDGLTTASDITVGMVFDVEGLYACHPETKQAYGHKQQFVVTAVANPSSGDADISFSPAIYTTGAKKNVVTSTGGAVTWTSTGQDGKDVTFWGSASTAYRQNLMYHRDAFAFVTADLPLMADAASCVRRSKDGLSMRVWKGSDIRNDELLMRIDVLYGYEALRPEWACRVSN